MIRTPFVAALVVVSLFISGSVFAKKTPDQNIDFGNVSCGDFIEGVATMDEETAGLVMVWLDGYLSGVSGDTELNWKSLETIGENLVEYCAKNADADVLEAVKEVGIE